MCLSPAKLKRLRARALIKCGGGGISLGALRTFVIAHALTRRDGYSAWPYNYVSGRAALNRNAKSQFANSIQNFAQSFV